MSRRGRHVVYSGPDPQHRWETLPTEVPSGERKLICTLDLPTYVLYQEDLIPKTYGFGNQWKLTFCESQRAVRNQDSTS